jgi:hypothetical protein
MLLHNFRKELHYSHTDIKRQSRIIFVEIDLKHITIGAEHLNI